MVITLKNQPRTIRILGTNLVVDQSARSRLTRIDAIGLNVLDHLIGSLNNWLTNKS